jgi:hypothetical protein
MKIDPKSYFKPTPKFMRIIGDTLLAMTGVSLSFDNYMMLHRTLYHIVIVVGILGKYLTNIFTNKENK